MYINAERNIPNLTEIFLDVYESDYVLVKTANHIPYVGKLCYDGEERSMRWISDAGFVIENVVRWMYIPK